MPTYQEAVAGFEKSGHFTFPFAVGDDMHTAVQSFLTFTALPQEKKDALRVSIAAGANKCNEVGYKKYDLYDSSQTNMEWFQYNTTFPDVTQLSVDTEAQEMVTAVDAVYAKAQDMLSGVVDMFATAFPHVRDAFYPGGASIPQYSAIRFIRYGAESENANHKYLGFTPHYDSGGCTFPLAESSPGLLVGRTFKDMAPAVHPQGTALMFPGMNFYKATDTKFRPSLHVVDPEQNSPVDADTARWVVIFFADHTQFKKCDVCSEQHW